MNRLALALIGFVLSSIVAAQGTSAGALFIERPWALPPPPGAASVAGYLSITNNGPEDDRLLGATAAFAGRVEVHETRIEDDVARMRKLDDGLLVPAGDTVMLEPNGAHLMLIDPEPVSMGERRTVTLHFERQGMVDVALQFERPDDMHGAPKMDH